ncbi:MAG TPA: hypothetical protein PKC40_06325, partial [Saprospiraceae bacterium]|nr:hypothetical protein [Saprospiraceae bacterium]
YDYRDKYFGNARTVRSIVQEAVKNQNLRLASFSKEERDVQSTKLLTLDDVASLVMDKDNEVFSRKNIGFKVQKKSS